MATKTLKVEYEVWKRLFKLELEKGYKNISLLINKALDALEEQEINNILTAEPI